MEEDEKEEERILRMSAEGLLSYLNTSPSGLADEEAEKRLREYGYNEIATAQKQGSIISFFSHFKSPLLILLLLAGAISYFFGETLNAAIIFSIVFLSAALDFYQESKAEGAAEMLKKKIATTAIAIRGGVKREISISEIVPGDMILLSAGNIVPADARVIDANDLFVNQSALTGEAFPAEKTAMQLKKKPKSSSEWSNYLFMGTSVVSGSATAAVIKTGSLTEYGGIAETLTEKKQETEFEGGLRRFGFLIMKVTLFLVIVVFLINALHKKNVLESMLFAVALAVGLTPELLPVIISVNLSKGALLMSKKGVIVKRLTSIQNLGSMDVLCTDKTGTLTENRIKLLLHTDIEGNKNEKVLLYSFINSYFETGLKSPLDEAILEYKHITLNSYKKADEVPFDFVRKRISVVVEHKGERILVSKGAPEEIISICSSCELNGKRPSLTENLKGKIQRKYTEFSSQGFRVLGVSYKKLKSRKKTYSVNDEKEMVFLGFVAFIDPPKKTARKSLQMLERAGVNLKILTGDNELVTAKVCNYLGFKIKGVVTGSEIAKMNDDALIGRIEQANIFVRLSPPQKNRIINALKSKGHVVGFLGDGINDAPSLKAADVGISVDNAVDVAKESADIILSKKSLNVLQTGVLEGRKTFGNSMKYIMMGTSSNFGNMFSVAAASIFLPFLPMLPIQILLNNFLYDISEITIPLDNVDPEYTKKPKRIDVSFIRRFMLFMGPVSSIFDFLIFFIMLYIFKASPVQFQTAWFIESLCTQVLVIFVIRTSRSPFYKSRPNRLLLLSSLFVIGIALIIPFTPIGRLFKFVELPFLFFVVLFGLVAAYLLLAELAKRQFYKKYPSI